MENDSAELAQNHFPLSIFPSRLKKLLPKISISATLLVMLSSLAKFEVIVF